MSFDLTKTNLDTNQKNTSQGKQYVHELTESEFGQISSELNRWHRELSMSIWVLKYIEAGLKRVFEKF